MQPNVFMFLFLKCFECNNIERNILIILYINIDKQKIDNFYSKIFHESMCQKLYLNYNIMINPNYILRIYLKKVKDSETISETFKSTKIHINYEIILD